jgi:hypothetical protein
MANVLYFGLWLAAALAVIGVLSAFLARQRPRGDARNAQGRLMYAALVRYGDWVGLQRHAATFQGEDADAAQALQDARLLGAQWFPELGPDMDTVLAVHARLLDFLGSQQALRLADPEAWIESDHDTRFQALAQEQAIAIAAMRAHLRMADDLAPDAAAGLSLRASGAGVDSPGA